MHRNSVNITVFLHLCCKKEGLTAGGQPIALSKQQAYALLQAPRIFKLQIPNRKVGLQT